MNSYKDFQKRFKILASKHPHIIINTLSNIFTMRLIGNKTHGDLAEIGMAEFINQFMYDFKSIHVGKDRFRAKEQEEDIIIINEITKAEFPVSLKAYGDGPLQLSTDKKQLMFNYLKTQGKDIKDKNKISRILSTPAFSEFDNTNVMPLIYNEKQKQCNIMIFDYEKAKKNTTRIMFIDKGERFSGNDKRKAKGRKHPIFMFLDKNNHYICEVRYGGTSANALQRGLWTNTKNAFGYFNSITNGWINYSHNQTLVRLFSLALNSSKASHEKANEILQEDINKLKEK